MTDLSESWATPRSARPFGFVIKPTKCIAAQLLLLESEPLLLLHMPKTKTFVPRTARFVAEAPLFSFYVSFELDCGRASAEDSVTSH